MWKLNTKVSEEITKEEEAAISEAKKNKVLEKDVSSSG